MLIRNYLGLYHFTHRCLPSYLNLIIMGKTKRNATSNSDGEAKQANKKQKISKDPPKTDSSATDSHTFDSDANNKLGQKSNFKIVSWNVNGIRAWLQKDGLSIIKDEDPDVLCLQETKCADGKLPDSVTNIKGYKSYFMSAEKEGYAGVAMFSKTEPISVTYGISDKEHDSEGRLLTLQFKDFYVVTAYVPNAGRKLITLDKRMRWDPLFLQHIKKLDEEKPVIMCGDLNVAHQPIDLANPKTNQKNAGFTKEERDGFTELLSNGFVDSYRHFYPDKTAAYTFWTYMMNARAKNVGWRLDYFVVSERLMERVCDSVIRSWVLGSDHCPITLLLHSDMAASKDNAK